MSSLISPKTRVALIQRVTVLCGQPCPGQPCHLILAPLLNWMTWGHPRRLHRGGGGHALQWMEQQTCTQITPLSCAGLWTTSITTSLHSLISKVETWYPSFRVAVKTKLNHLWNATSQVPGTKWKHVSLLGQPCYLIHLGGESLNSNQHKNACYSLCQSMLNVVTRMRSSKTGSNPTACNVCLFASLFQTCTGNTLWFLCLRDLMKFDTYLLVTWALPHGAQCQAL